MSGLEICYTNDGQCSAAIQERAVVNLRQFRSIRPFRSPCCRVTLAATLFAAALLVSDRPLPGRFQRIALFLALQPCFKSRFVNPPGENPRLAEQSSKRLHYLCRGGEHNLVHGFRLSP